MAADTDKLFKRLDVLLDRLELIIPTERDEEQDWSYSAYRWIDQRLIGITDFHRVDPAELLHIDRQQRP